MGAHKADICYSAWVEDPGDNPVVVVSDPKHHPVSSDYAGVGVASDNVSRGRPVRLSNLPIPCEQMAEDAGQLQPLPTCH